MKKPNMPPQIQNLLGLLSGNFYNILNFSIVLCTFMESYIFPFAVIKWMMVLTKYGGLVKFVKDSVQTNSPTRSRYNYSLELLTSSRHDEMKVDHNLISHVSVVIEVGCDAYKWMQLSYCGQECQKIPPALWNMYGSKVHYLDLSYNSIETLKGLENFINLEELILDNNRLGDAVSFPRLARLKTLSLNNNLITDLENLVNQLSERFPSLSYLSLLSNKACPNQLSDLDKDDSDYQRYRFYVIHKLPTLRFLDSRRVSPWELREARIRGEFARVRRPAPLPSLVSDVITHAPARRPLPVDLAALGKHRGAYGKCHFNYTGKHSEGNRFIVNSDL